ncbi:MAG: hypothetical protein GXP54_01125 [Deltaproteobacteria bacterium]|nr:hypothetical protein [Deltaproteobacteria bacterium]
MTTKFFKVAAVMSCALMLTAIGCKKDQTGGPAARAALKADVGTVAFPNDILVFGGMKSLDDFTGAMTALVSKFEPQMGAMIGAQVPALLQGQVLGVKNLAWMDHTKPLKFVVLDYKKFSDPLLILLPIKSSEGFKQALPDNKSAGAPDNQTKYTFATGSEHYANVIGDWAVFSADAKAFSAAKPFIEGPFKDYVFSELLDVQISSTRFMQVAGADIAAFKENVTKLPTTPGLEIPGIQEMLKKEIQMLLDILDQTETARFVMRFNGDVLTLRGGVKVAPGKGLAKFVADTKDRKLDLYKSLPANGWFETAVNVDPSLFKDWADIGVDFWAGILKLEQADKDKLVKEMSRLLTLETGEMAFWIGYDGQFPFRFLSITGVKDAAGAKDAMYKTYGILFSKAGALIKSMAGPNAADMPQMDWSSPKALLASLKPELDKSGVTAAITSKKVGEIDVDALEIGVDYSKVPIPADKEDVKKITDSIGDKLSFALGFGNGLMYGTFGQDAVADVGKIAKGQGGDRIKELITGADTRAAAVVWFGLRDILRFVSRIDADLARNMPNLDTMKDPIGISFVLGGRDDRIMDAELKIPITSIAGLIPRPGANTGAAPATP